MRIYVASSWRNTSQPSVVQALRNAGYEVYDFRNPPHGRGGFDWADIDPNWESWTAKEYRAALDHPIAIDGYNTDKAGMDWAEAFVMVDPCGRSANREAGWSVGTGRPCWTLLADGEPELMLRMDIESGGDLCCSLEELVAKIADWEKNGET